MLTVNYAEFENASDVRISLHLDWINSNGAFSNTIIQPGEVARVAGFDSTARAHICHRSDGGTFAYCPATSPIARAGDYFILKADGGYQSSSRDLARSPASRSLLRLNERAPKAGWIVVAAEVIYELAYSYQAFKGGGDNNQMLDSINKQLKNIEAKLNDVIDRIDDVLMTLRALPAAVQQVVDEAFLKRTVTHVRSSTQQIQALSDPKYIHQNVLMLENVLSKLQDEINELAGVKGDTARVMLAISAYTTFLNGRVALEKEKKKQDPAHQIQSPWSLPLNDFVKAQFQDILHRADGQQQFYDDECKMPSVYGEYLKIGGRYFVPSASRGNGGIGGIVLPKIGDYRILKAESVPGGVVEYWCDVYRDIRPTDGIVFYPGWFDVREPYRNDEYEANRRFQLIFSDQQEMSFFKEFFDKIVSGRGGLLQCFNEPPQVWD